MKDAFWTCFRCGRVYEMDEERLEEPAPGELYCDWEADYTVGRGCGLSRNPNQRPNYDRRWSGSIFQ